MAWSGVKHQWNSSNADPMAPLYHAANDENSQSKRSAAAIVMSCEEIVYIMPIPRPRFCYIKSQPQIIKR